MIFNNTKWILGTLYLGGRGGGSIGQSKLVPDYLIFIFSHIISSYIGRKKLQLKRFKTDLDMLVLKNRLFRFNYMHIHIISYFVIQHDMICPAGSDRPKWVHQSYPTHYLQQLITRGVVPHPPPPAS